MRRLVAQGLALIALPLLTVGCLKPTRDELRAQYHKRGAITAERRFASQFRPPERVPLFDQIRLRTGLRVLLIEIDGAPIPPQHLPLLNKERWSTANYRPANLAYLPTGAESIRLRYIVSKGSEESTYEIEWELARPIAGVRYQTRSAARLMTYPVWGLPRDLIDLPFTGARRLGFADGGGPDDEDPARKIAVNGAAGVGLIAAPTLVILAVSPVAVAIPLAFVAMPVGMIAGGIVGLWVTNSFVSVGRGTSDLLQVPLLRGGIDSEDWFPNWKFGAMRPVVTYGDGPRMWRVVNVERIRTP